MVLQLPLNLKHYIFILVFKFIIKNRGATLADGTTYGNTIANQRSLTVNGKLNFENLYNKVDFLKETNKKFASTKGKSSATMSTQATSGNKAVKVSLSADYTFSRMLTLNAYFDHQTNIPVVSASSYPTSTNDFGISLKFSLTR